MLLKVALLEQEENQAKHRISRLQRDRDCGVITDEEYEEKYETVMQNLRLRYADLMGRSAVEREFLDTD